MQQAEIRTMTAEMQLLKRAVAKVCVIQIHKHRITLGQ